MQYLIDQLPESERPRERLIKHGAEALTTAELIAIILGSGMKGMSVLQIAQEIVTQFGDLQQFCEATNAEMRCIKGLGPAKALQLKAAINLGIRIARKLPTVRHRIEHPAHAYTLVKDELEKETREVFMVILQDTRGYVLSHHQIAIGSLTHAFVHPREVFHLAIRHHAASIILVHNHPSGDPTPSKHDYDLTTNLIEVSKVIGIPINDHLIIGTKKFTSLRQLGFNFNI